MTTMQRIMRHSDPKLAANYWTHVLIEDKAEALAKLPIIAAIDLDTQQEAMTGTTGEATTEYDEIMDTHEADADGRTRTYANGKRSGKASMSGTPKTKNALSHKGKQGEKDWWAVLGSNQSPPACKAGALAD